MSHYLGVRANISVRGDPRYAVVLHFVCHKQVGKEFTTRMDLDSAEYVPPELFPAACGEVGARPAHRTAVVNACVYVHQTLHQANARLAKRANRTMAITPRSNNNILT